jgi:hypothetical protein
MQRSAFLLHLALGAACGDAVGASGSSGETGEPATTAAVTSTAAPTSTTTSSSTSSSSSGPDCPANTPPAAPELQEPLAGRIDVIPDELTIVGTSFTDPDPGDAPGGLEAEIWRVKDGTPDTRVWHATRDEVPPLLTLADGEFDDPDDTTLEAWEDHVVRLRHRDEHAACSAWSPWSEDRSFRTDDGSSVLFAETTILDFHLEIPPDSWTKINAEANPPGCVPFVRSYHSGTLRLGDQSFPGAGIKIKGGCGSSRDLGGKASFKVNLEWDNPKVVGCPGERRLLGEKHFTFNNGVQDRSASNERLGYPLFRALGVPAPRAASVRLFVNDELWGLYTHVETIDRRFLARWFADNRRHALRGHLLVRPHPRERPADRRRRLPLPHPRVRPSTPATRPTRAATPRLRPPPRARPRHRRPPTGRLLPRDHRPPRLGSLPHHLGDRERHRPLGQLRLHDQEQLPPLPRPRHRPVGP